jgi:ketosteroid isomerase-like protein
MRAQTERRLAFQRTLKPAFVLVLFCWFALPAQAAVFPHHDSLHKEIEGLELEWRDALVNNNLPAIDRLLADDYLGIGANGTLETKADVLATHRSGSLKITLMNLSDLKIRVYGDTAVVTSKADLDGTNGGRDISGHYRYTRVYSYRDGQWRIVSFEASRLPGESERAEKR